MLHKNTSKIIRREGGRPLEGRNANESDSLPSGPSVASAGPGREQAPFVARTAGSGQQACGGPRIDLGPAWLPATAAIYQSC